MNYLSEHVRLADREPLPAFPSCVTYFKNLLATYQISAHVFRVCEILAGSQCSSHFGRLSKWDRARTSDSCACLLTFELYSENVRHQIGLPLPGTQSVMHHVCTHLPINAVFPATFLVLLGKGFVSFSALAGLVADACYSWYVFDTSSEIITQGL